MTLYLYVIIIITNIIIIMLLLLLPGFSKCRSRGSCKGTTRKLVKRKAGSAPDPVNWNLRFNKIPAGLGARKSLEVPAGGISPDSEGRGVEKPLWGPRWAGRLAAGSSEKEGPQAA